MPDFMEILKERRSVRRYLDRDIPDDVLATVLEAVQWSPSWGNTQCWEVVAARSEEIKKKLQETIAPKNPATKAVISAPVVLALCGRLEASGYYNNAVTTRFGDWFMFDLGIAAQSITLAAQSLGLASVIVGLYDHDRVDMILDVPKGYQNVALIPIGYPEKIPPAPKRKALDEFVHEDSFQRR